MSTLYLDLLPGAIDHIFGQSANVKSTVGIIPFSIVNRSLNWVICALDSRLLALHAIISRSNMTPNIFRIVQKNQYLIDCILAISLFVATIATALRILGFPQRLLPLVIQIFDPDVYSFSKK